MISKNNNYYYHDLTSAFSNDFPKKDPHLNAVELWKTIEGNTRLRVRVRIMVRFLYFILKSHPVTCDVTCSRLYLDGKNMRTQCQMTHSLLRLEKVRTNITYVCKSQYAKHGFGYCDLVYYKGQRHDQRNPTKNIVWNHIT